MSKTLDAKRGRTVMVPITTMEEMPILTDEERMRMLASLRAAEARVAAGHYDEHDPETFVDRLMEVREAAIRNKTA